MRRLVSISALQLASIQCLLAQMRSMLVQTSMVHSSMVRSFLELNADLGSRDTCAPYGALFRAGTDLYKY